jgi:LDH2 family malate/lactate/ureidoglycolate dehydrogenase
MPRPRRTASAPTGGIAPRPDRRQQHRTPVARADADARAAPPARTKPPPISVGRRDVVRRPVAPRRARLRDDAASSHRSRKTVTDPLAAHPDAALPHVALADLAHFSIAALTAAGADQPTAAAATAAMLHGSRLGVDSHGIRLLPHYARAIRGGRVNGRPNMRFVTEFGVVATLDADAAHGALAASHAMAHAVDMARRSGLAAVAIRNSSHFGPAGAFALPAAEAGLIGLVTCNSDAFVRLHDGAERFHGTNPMAVAVPSGGERPWLMDMATSAVPYNRVKLYRSLGRAVPDDVASDADGHPTTVADAVAMLAPVGAAFGFKGAALGGLVEILSGVLSGATLSPDIAPMGGADLKTPRDLGAFVLALDPGAFGDRAAFLATMARYLGLLRASRPAPGAAVMAPGDREWAEAARRERLGVAIDPETAAGFAELTATYGIAPPASLPTA